MTENIYSSVVADISVECCSLSLLTLDKDNKPYFSSNLVLSASAYGQFDEMLSDYLKRINLTKLPELLGITMSGPIVADELCPLKLHWRFTRASLEEKFGFTDIIVQNDVSAIASSLPWLQDCDVQSLCEPAMSQNFSLKKNRVACLYPVHGLGISALKETTKGLHPIETEGGHAAFSPRTPLEKKISQRLEDSHGFVSIEHFLTDEGLTNIYAALCDIDGVAHTPLSAQEVILYGSNNADEQARKSLDVFMEALGAVAGDAALNLLAVDGVLLAGPIVNSLKHLLPDSAFRKAFESKGDFVGFMRDIPTYIITNPSPRFIGLSRTISNFIEERNSSQVLPSAGDLLTELSIATNQSVTILNDDFNIIAHTARIAYDTFVDPTLYTPGQSYDDVLSALTHSSAFGLGDPAQKLADLKKKFATGKPFEYQREIFGGQHIAGNVHPRTNGGFIIIETDVTAMHNSTQELETLSVKLRTEKINSDSASRSKSEFLANMSHEIRTPLNGVLGMADLMTRTSLDVSQQDMLSVIDKSGNALLTIINDILDFSKIEAGKLRLQQSSFNLRSCVDDIAALFATQAEAKGLEMIVRYRPDTPEHFIGDSGRVRQILTNLVGNALKFTEAGYLMVDVTAHTIGDSAEIRIDVVDTGCGIPSAKLARVFEKFEQVDSSSTRQAEGTGLGLSITKRLAELMGGGLSATSTEGEGSCFTASITLPISAAIEGQVPKNETINISDKRILIVDDLAVNRKILVEQTKSWGVNAEVAEDGFTALDLLRTEYTANRTFDAAILDFQMPGMDGLMLAEKIKSDPILKNLPLILLTSVGHAVDVRKEEQHHLAAYLVKPARSATLLSTLQDVLQNKDTVSQTETSNEIIEDTLQKASQHPTQAHPTPATSTIELPVQEKVCLDIETVVVPAAKPTPSSSKKQPPLKKENQENHENRKIKVLVAEDNPTNQLVIKTMLSNGGYDVVMVENGEAAVAAYRDINPDIVLMDVSMPVMDGFSATQKIRGIEQENDATAPTPVIGVTAHALPEDERRCLDAGMDGYLSKPVKQSDLETTIASFVEEIQQTGS